MLSQRLVDPIINGLPSPAAADSGDSTHGEPEMLKYYIIGVAACLAVASVAILQPEFPGNDISVSNDGSPSPIHADGFLQGATRSVELRTRLSGRVAVVHFAVGQKVQPGDVLLELENHLEVERVAQARASANLAAAKLARLINGAHIEERREAQAVLRSRQIRHQQASRQLERLLSLSRQAISQQELDNQQGLVSALEAEVIAAQAQSDLLSAPARADDVKIADAELQNARAEFAAAELMKSYMRLVAPSSGTVLDIDAEIGEMTGPGAPRPLIVISDLSQSRVRAYVDEYDAARVNVGMPAVITAEGLSQTYAGHVIKVSPRMQQKWFATDSPTEMRDTRVREIELHVSVEEEIIIGLRVDVKIMPDEPSTAIASSH